MIEPFRPAVWAKSPHLQTIFGSLKMRIWGKNEMTDVSQEVIVNAGSGVRLLGYHSQQLMPQTKGLIILLHGWEGSSDSTYILSTGRFFLNQG
jgi:predicted alpha/beta-fold hydrolase